MNIVKTFFKENFIGQPEGFGIILYTEICELFGRFGITALLVLYLTSDLKFTDHNAFALYGAFTALIFIVPLIGGYYADKFLGYKSAITLGIALMGIGNILIAVPQFLSLYLHFPIAIANSSLYIGLAIIAVGCGFFTPSLTALLGKLYHGREQNRDNAFVMYYIAKNMGALLAIIFCSLIGQAYGYSYAFILSSAVMLSGLAVFSLNIKKLKHIIVKNKAQQTSHQTVVKKQSKSLLHIAVILTLIIGVCFILRNHVTSYLFITSIIIATGVFARLYFKTDSTTRHHLNQILLALVAMIIFSMFLGQGGTTLNLFIERIINRNVGSLTIPPSMFYALDPLFMLLFGGFVMHILGKLKHKNATTNSLYKLAFGLFVLCVGFFVFVIASQYAMHSGHKPTVLFVFLGYMIFPISELAIMPITVSLVTRLAPKNKDGLMVSFYLFGQGIASYLTGSFSKLGTVNFKIINTPSFIHAASIYHHVFSLSSLSLLMAAIVTFIYIRLSKRLKQPVHAINAY